ncbi:MAG TPA: tetratricopeptide repeat protein, partial [candidate division Zixibacteria bacterium]|nr:tetratricopeptide repeat protein [candidate division Zixibacteria bacterium]
LNTGDTQLAAEIFRERAWDYPPSQFELGKLLFDTGKYRESVEVLKIAEKKDPFNAKIYYILSEAFEATGDNHSAREAWRRYLELPGIKTAEFIGDEDAPGVIQRKKQED